MSIRNFFLSFILFIFFFSCATNQTIDSKQIRIEGNKQFYLQSSFEYKEGVPFLELKGTPYEQGLAYGLFLKDDIKKSTKNAENMLSSFLNLMPIVESTIARTLLNEKIKSKKHTIPKKYREELQGISDASGINYDRLCSLIFFADITGSLSCTSIVKETEEGLIHGRNLDFMPPNILGTIPVVINYYPEDGFKYTVIGLIGAIPALTGMNEKKIAVSLNQSNVTKSEGLGSMPIGYFIRDILSSKESIEEIDKTIFNYKSDNGWILTISSGDEKKYAIYDIAKETIKKHTSATTYLFAENTFLSQELNKTQRPISKAGGAYNRNRIKRASELVPKIKNLNDMLITLQDTEYQEYSNTVGFFTINNYETIQTIIMLPEKETILFSYGNGFAPYERLLKYSLNDKNLSVYKEKDERLKNKEIIELKAWITQFFTNPKDALKNPIHVQYSLEMIDSFYKINKNIIDFDTYIHTLDSMIEKYPTVVMPYWLKAKQHLSLGDYTKALSVLNKTQNLIIDYPFDDFMITSLYAETYSKSNSNLASSYAQKALELLNTYSDDSQSSKIRIQMQNILKIAK